MPVLAARAPADTARAVLEEVRSAYRADTRPLNSFSRAAPLAVRLTVGLHDVMLILAISTALKKDGWGCVVYRYAGGQDSFHLSEWKPGPTTVN